jgi:hypothetical protein
LHHDEGMLPAPLPLAVAEVEVVLVSVRQEGIVARSKEEVCETLSKSEESSRGNSEAKLLVMAHHYEALVLCS